MAEPREALLSVEDLRVEFWTTRGTIYAVNGISFDIAPGETLGIVGESGCGKSVTALALLGILSRAGRTPTGSALFGGRDLLKLSDRQLRGIRGKEIAMIFQDPMTSLNPVLTVGRQLREALETHFGMNKKEATDRAAELIDRVGIPSARRAAQGLPASVLRRDAPARHDRDGARLQAEAPDRRRADDGPRRDDPGADPQSAARARRRGEHRDDPHHARPRCRRRHVRAGERDVRRDVHGDGRGRASSSRARATRTRSGSSRASRGSTRRARQAAADPGEPARHARAAGRLPVPAALPVRGRVVEPGGAAARRDRERSQGGVLQPGARRRVAALASGGVAS